MLIFVKFDEETVQKVIKQLKKIKEISGIKYLERGYNLMAHYLLFQHLIGSSVGRGSDIFNIISPINSMMNPMSPSVVAGANIGANSGANSGGTKKLGIIYNKSFYYGWDLTNSLDLSIECVQFTVKLIFICNSVNI